MKIRESIPDFHFLNADFILLALNYSLPKTTMNEVSLNFKVCTRLKV